MVKKLIAWLANLIVRLWPSTPYYHLYGYMMRWWLVPYNTPVLRKVPATEFTDAYETADGTGPLPWHKRPISRLIQTFGIAVRVHDILRSDLDRQPHDHPWPYMTIILSGGYYEVTFNEFGDSARTRWHGPGSVLFRKATSWHMLLLPENSKCRTLFITGKKCQTWGFNVDGMKVPYYEYLKEKA